MSKGSQILSIDGATLKHHPVFPVPAQRVRWHFFSCWSKGLNFEPKGSIAKWRFASLSKGNPGETEEETVTAQPEHLEREGFQVTNKVFTHPSSALDPITKRHVTICNLFANHDLSISDIVRVLDETYGNVVTVLIKQGYILERRKHSREPASVERSGHVSRLIC